MSRKHLKVNIITTESFPAGMAASNRIMSYAKGFVEHNCDVSVHCMRPTEKSAKIFNESSCGIIDGVHYSYPGGKTVISSNIISRKIDDIRGLLKTCINILKEKGEAKSNAIIYYSPSTSRAFLIFLITRIKGIIFLKEENEMPYVRLRNMYALQKFLFKKFHYQLFDGLLLMTNRLIKYFVEERKISIPYLHVPMTVNFNRFINIEKEKNPYEYIAYCGVLNSKKDGTDLLIDAFAILAKEFPNIHLYLVGETSSPQDHEFYLKKVSKYHLSEKVFFTGRVDKEKIPKILCNASILALPRPKSLQAEGGFPTKLGEYLATGNPVVATSVGDISDYLTNEVSVFMAEPDCVESLVNKMRDILNDYPKAKMIGENGKKVAMNCFNYQTQTKNILNFIESLKNKRID